jgi:hypothetical protein
MNGQHPYDAFVVDLVHLAQQGGERNLLSIAIHLIQKSLILPGKWHSPVDSA